MNSLHSSRVNEPFRRIRKAACGRLLGYPPEHIAACRGGPPRQRDLPNGRLARHALSDIDLEIRDGEFVALIDPSGCGKTTLMRVIADLEKISAGEVLVNGVSPHDARLARAYGYVFQAPALFPWRTVLANVTLPLQIQRPQPG